MDTHTGITADTITSSVQAAFADGGHPRLAALLPLVVGHLHAIVRDARLTPEDWHEALAFLAECAAFTSQERNEFALLSDILGISSLVDLLQASENATPGSLLGPFYNPDSPLCEHRADLIRCQTGLPTLFRGTVADPTGRGIAGAVLDFWQNADNGLYPAMDPAQHPHNLRCRLICDAAGGFEIRTIRPRPYSVPTDGPVGKLLTLLGKATMRPAHWHIYLRAPGYQPLVTELFPADDPHLSNDPVFSIRPGLLVDFVHHDNPNAADEHRLTNPFAIVDYAFKLHPLG